MYFCCNQLQRLQQDYPKTSNCVLIERNNKHDQGIYRDYGKCLLFGLLYLYTVRYGTVGGDDRGKKVMNYHTGQK